MQGCQNPCKGWSIVEQFEHIDRDVVSDLRFLAAAFEITTSSFVQEYIIPQYRSHVRRLRKRNRRFNTHFNGTGRLLSGDTDCLAHPGQHQWVDCPQNPLNMRRNLLPRVVAFVGRDDSHHNLLAMYEHIKHNNEELLRT